VITPENAKKQLDAWRVETEDRASSAADRFLPQVKKLPANLTEIGFAILGRDTQGKELTGDWNVRRKLQEKSASFLDELPIEDRLKIFRVLLGNLARPVEAAWQYLKNSTYQVGYARKSFHAPRYPAATHRLRSGWLQEMLKIAAQFKPEIVTPQWLAIWVPHMGYHADQNSVGRFLAAVIAAGGPGGDEVFEILCQSARAEHEIGCMGRHVARALLMTSRPEAWELMEKMLLAAQRQEGLRQVILETVDEAHPEAYRRMMRLIRDHELGRFSAVVRSANVWFGLQWDSVSVKTVNAAIDQVLGFLDDSKSRDETLANGDPERVFLALWSIAFDDALASIPVAEKLLKAERVELRFVAALHLVHLDLPQTRVALAGAMGDEELHVALCASQGVRGDGEDGEIGVVFGERRFELLQRLFDRLPPKPITLKAMVWPWTERKASREEIAQLLVFALGERPPTMLIPYVSWLKTHYRSRVVQLLSEQNKWDTVTRETLISLAGDASSDVRTSACQALAKLKLETAEIGVLEGYMSRKASDLRQGVVGLLLRQTDGQSLATADRLLASKDAMQRLAGLEVVRQLAEAKRGRAACQERAATYKSARKKLSQEEQSQIDAIAGASSEQLTLDNALGLMDPANRSPAIAPKAHNVKFVTDAAVKCIESLDNLVHENREAPIRISTHRGVTEGLLGTIQYGFPSPEPRRGAVRDKTELPLADVWESWFASRSKRPRDKDGLELLRAKAWLLQGSPRYYFGKDTQAWAKGSAERVRVLSAISGSQGRPAVKLKYPAIVASLVDWCLFLHPPAGALEFLLDAVETLFCLVPEEDMRKLANLPVPNPYASRAAQEEADWREVRGFTTWWRLLGSYADASQENDIPAKAAPTRQQIQRRWQLARWLDEPFPGAGRKRPDFSTVMQAYDHGAATLADVFDHLLGPGRRSGYRYGSGFGTLVEFTTRKVKKGTAAFLARHTEVAEAVERCRERIVEIELARGELPTAATEPAWAIRALWGTELLVSLMTALGKAGFKVPLGWKESGRESKTCTLTQLVSVTYPKRDETIDDFRRLIGAELKSGRLTQQKVLELAFLAPQWAKHIESLLDWDGLAEALYWFLAHMRYTDAREDAALAAGVEDEAEGVDAANAADDPPKPSAWERLVAERTPLADSDRQGGAIDVGWFRRVYDQVKPKRWLAMAEAARFAANAAQARHAQFVADVLIGKASRKQLIDGVRKKQLKDYVRLLGLYPLAQGEKRQADLLQRYNVLQEYRRYARGLSGLTKPEAMRSVDVGVQNLASTAGYADSLRLEWAMEAEQVSELAAGPVSVKEDGVTVTLTLDAEARPQITVERAGKPLKSVPPDVKKDKRVAELSEQAAHLKRQASRMKASLEAAMCRGDSFTSGELVDLCHHAILAPLLTRLVLVGEGVMGYPDRGGKALRDAQGKLEPVKKAESLRIAHAHDLFTSGNWDQYQHECFQAERVQPFKQVFRELYVVTKQEKSDRTVSRRYAGQQIQPQQAMALWGQRGWNTQDGIWKSFHDVGIVASVSFQYGGGTPLDVEGWTFSGVDFRRRDELKPLDLVKVPPRLFSEVMRDVDLVVSVAHRGGVDPEASASTVEMRAALLRETCALLGMNNVRIKSSHALIDGQLGNYSIHLGSATVHRMPGGSVCIVAVPAQHRGRLFLPFADDDPRTAEVISKTILLARDTEIQDPTILEQLRA
jgi:hypothetical protein